MVVAVERAGSVASLTIVRGVFALANCDGRGRAGFFGLAGDCCTLCRVARIVVRLG